MIVVEFLKPTSDGYAVHAQLSVHEGTWVWIGDLDRRLLKVAILLRSRPGGLVFFDEDPEAWARNVHRAFRTGYLVPRIVRDDAAPELKAAK